MTALWYVIPLAAALLYVLDFLGRVHEWHHGDYGLVLLALPWWPAKALGALLYADDLYQHGVQAIALSRGGRVPPDFTPIHRLGAAIVGAWQHRGGR